MSQLIGDRIEQILLAIGVTKERWTVFVSTFGEPPTSDCGGCDKRQQSLNDADLYMRNLAAELGSAAANAVSKVWAPIGWLREKTASNQSGTSSPRDIKMED